MKDRRKFKVLSFAVFAALMSASSAHADNLLDVYWVAEKNDPILRSADSSRQVAKERYSQAFAGLLPNIQGSADGRNTRRAYGDIDDSNSNANFDVGLTQPVYRQETYKSLNVTNARIEQADAQFSATQRKLMTRVATAYFNVLAAADTLEFVVAEKEALTRQLDQTKQRFEVGLIAITDVHEAQAAYDLTVASEITAQNDLSNAREVLRELTGQYHDNLRPLGEMAPAAPEPNDVAKWVDTALRTNFTVAAAQANVEAAREEQSRQRAGHMPYVDLIGNYSYSSDAGLTFQDEDLSVSTVMLKLTVPIYSGGAVSARTREAAYLYEQAKDTLEQARREAQRNVSAAFLNVNATIARIKALGQAVISTESALKASEAGLEVGTRTTLDVLNTRRELFRARRDLARARYDHLLSVLQLKEAAGTLSMADFEQTNALLQ